MKRARTVAAVAALLLACAGAAAAQSSDSYFNVVDSDQDGRISLAEYQDRLSYAFRQMDRNHDDVVDESEQLVRGAKRMTLAELHAQLAAQFRRQDKNKDGSLSPREFLAPPA